MALPSPFMRIGAIDIGSNAVRLIIKEVRHYAEEYESFKVCYTRVPIRLGSDVFTTGLITETKRNQLAKTMQAFKLLMEVQGVKDFRACSTSAMREAKNGKEVIAFMKEQADVDVELLSGEDEAEAILANFSTQRLVPGQKYAYIDVGGGSTEISVIQDGERIISRSFRIGTVRLLHERVDAREWEELRVFCDALLAKHGEMIGIGTGGNINRIYKEAGKTQLTNITVSEIDAVKKVMESYSFDERIFLLKLKPDRADVIIPAANIYLEAMHHAGIKQMNVPKLGLSDGLIMNIFNRLEAEHKLV
jgi:exopolyphosphatase / guanosine-5'-triphosphate,3'-diphosphate pyrophosphatase